MLWLSRESPRRYIGDLNKSNKGGSWRNANNDNNLLALPDSAKCFEQEIKSKF